MKKFSDEKLIKEYLRGDEKALEELIRRYLPLIYNFSRRYAGDSDNASDITQEVFVKVWKNIRKFDNSKKFRFWIFTIAKNTALDWLKKKNALPFSILNEGGKEENFEEQIADEKELPAIERFYRGTLLNELDLAIEKLPVRYNSIMNLRHRDNLNFREISERLNEPIDTVKSRYRRGINLIKKMF